ncbi:MAG TPA: DUF5678 domain-containing protein [Syntrophales bacterium]|nr:DUF5678 domain-containing protein [Syntrophales bacterium]
MSKKLKASKDMRDSLKVLCGNWQWLHGNFTAIQEKYAGKWIAITAAQVVSVGLTSRDVKANLPGNYQQQESLILYVPEEEVSRPM